MSADNWTMCPKCAKAGESKREAAQRLADAAYGKVSAAEYAALLAAASQAVDEEPEPTLREDYEIGIHAGEFRVNYRARCTACGWSFAFKPKPECAS